MLCLQKSDQSDGHFLHHLRKNNLITDVFSPHTILSMGPKHINLKTTRSRCKKNAHNLQIQYRVFKGLLKGPTYIHLFICLLIHIISYTLLAMEINGAYKQQFPIVN